VPPDSKADKGADKPRLQNLQQRRGVGLIKLDAEDGNHIQPGKFYGLVLGGFVFAANAIPEFLDAAHKAF
jgi:hypothetical protein